MYAQLLSVADIADIANPGQPASQPASQAVSQSASQSVSLAGLLFVLYAIFAFNKNTPSPSLHTLIPTIGAGLILAFSNDKNLVGKLLGNQLFVGVGLISYSAYLWHQPIIAFSKLRGLFGNDLIEPRLIVIASLALAFLTWKFIENPFRNKNLVSSKLILLFSIIGVLFFIAVGVTIYQKNGFRNFNNRVPPNIIWQTFGEKFNIKGDICTLVAYKKSGISICNFGDLNSNKNIVLYGDSHAVAISEELNKVFNIRGIKGTKIAIDGCDIVPELRIYRKTNTDITDRCTNGFKNMLSYIKDLNAEVILASRWTFKLYPIKGVIDDLQAKNSEGGAENEVDYREYVSIINGKISFDGESKKIALNNFMDEILLTTKKLYLIYPIPEVSWDIARTNISFYGINKRLLSEISIPYADFKRRNIYVNTVFNEYEQNPKVIAIKPENIFCNSYVKDRCVAQFETIPFYYDDNHLSDIGAQLLVEKLNEKFN